MPNGRGGENISGIRFGHVSSIEVVNDESALFTLKSGDEFELSSRASDIGTGLRALIVDEPDGGSYEFSWRELDIIDFLPVPSAHKPNEGRLYGTMTTRGGMEFTGFLTWDVAEIYTTDILNGDLDRQARSIPVSESDPGPRHRNRVSRGHPDSRLQSPGTYYYHAGRYPDDRGGGVEAHEPAPAERSQVQ